jgi:formylglycine-generating enzyme required for sulfatase activity
LADIFLSYKKEDFARAEKIELALRGHGLSVWWDDALTPRESWDTTIETQLNLAGAVVVLWSTLSVGSDWVRREAHFGQDRNKLIPVLLDNCSIPIAFTLNQAISLVNWDGDVQNRQFRKLLVWIADLCSTKPGEANLPGNLVAAAGNRFLDAIGNLPTGEPFFEGDLINISSPAGTLFRDGPGLPIMRVLAKSTFLLGAVDTDPNRTAYETPQIRVEIQNPFALGIYTVCVKEFEAITPSAAAQPVAAQQQSSWHTWFHKSSPAPATIPAVSQPVDDALPVTSVDFNQAQAYVTELSKKTGKNYRIPSEAEWEFACRAGTSSPYCWGWSIESTQAAYNRASGPVKAGTFPPNAFGMFDMHGNVREWVTDRWHDCYDQTPPDARPALAGHSSMRVVRGGGWGDPPEALRSSSRQRATESQSTNMIGFRIARSLD